MLTLSKVETQSILTNKQRFNLGEQVRQCVLMLESKLEKKNVFLNADIYDEDVVGNKEMLNQVWLNLLDNAIKFTPSLGMIDLIFQKMEDSIVIVVRDTGCGISQEALPRIFDKFYQQDTSHATAGNGLGLSIVYKIIDLHKGTIQCDSQVSKGTTFTICLPIA